MSEKRQGDQTTRGANVGVRLGRGGLAAWLVGPPSLTHQAGHHRRIVELGTVGEKEFSCVVLLVFVFWIHVLGLRVWGFAVLGLCFNRWACVLGCVLWVWPTRLDFRVCAEHSWKLGGRAGNPLNR